MPKEGLRQDFQKKLEFSLFYEQLALLLVSVIVMQTSLHLNISSEIGYAFFSTTIQRQVGKRHHMTWLYVQVPLKLTGAITGVKQKHKTIQSLECASTPPRCYGDVQGSSVKLHLKSSSSTSKIRVAFGGITCTQHSIPSELTPNEHLVRIFDWLWMLVHER